MRCNTLQHTATHCNTLRHTATHCNTLWLFKETYSKPKRCTKEVCALQCVAVCCSVLQCVAVCCSVLQCVALQRFVRSLFIVSSVFFVFMMWCCIWKEVRDYKKRHLKDFEMRLIKEAHFLYWEIYFFLLKNVCISKEMYFHEKRRAKDKYVWNFNKTDKGGAWKRPMHKERPLTMERYINVYIMTIEKRCQHEKKIYD